ncbi:peptidylprolyl isomerase [Mariluticola halotolerans]|uniref:peptidylprolyl isomerase n=1 Tax=Mariluticola halotolerans TaxID=2909283 RepID=UPI0026E28E70|nr:peptidylprolyl isomerase [Mariluticola halotolerans]UJQ93844.1 peptidylprolyl isomerase [Mariluticola halotolerans]
MTNQSDAPFSRSIIKSLGVCVALLGMCAAPQALYAQEQAATPSPDSVVATVDGEAITEGDLAFAAEDLAQEMQNIPPQGRRSFLTSVLIDMKVMAKAARAENMQDSDVFRRRQKYLEDRSLRRAYFAEKIGTQVTEESVKAAYDKLVAGFEPQDEIHARHILVAEEADAKTIRAEIEGGKPFEVAAMENSIDGSSKNGGDLGYFVKGQMVPPFEAAAFALEPGQVSEPVQSQFGWHLIKLEDRRQSAPPPLEQVAPQLQQQVLFEAFNASMTTLKNNVDIEIPDAALAAEIEKNNQGALQ